MSALVFVVGLFLGLFLVTALYRLIDLWYCIGARWPDVAWRYGRAAVVLALVVWLVPARHEGALWWGIAAYVVMTTTFWYALQALFYLTTRRRPAPAKAPRGS